MKKIRDFYSFVSYNKKFKIDKLKIEDIINSKPLLTKNFQELVEIVAVISYYNRNFFLFYRGQKEDHKDQRGISSTFYPTIYRGIMSKKEREKKIDLLDNATDLLIKHFDNNKVTGMYNIKRFEELSWAILQHYQVCETPLLDFTQSLRVACSFALLDNNSKYGYVYVFGFPYITDSISYNIRHELVNIKLLGICPPQAIRPYFQEGYTAGSFPFHDIYKKSARFDFKWRLLAKFKINKKTFWDNNFTSIPKDALFPKNDKFFKICKKLKTNLK